MTLKNLTAKDIQEFYLSELERVSPSSVIHYHANIHKALKYAVKIDLIDVNPADKVERPKKDRYVGSFYDADEVNALFEAAKGSKLEFPILFGASTLTRTPSPFVIRLLPVISTASAFWLRRTPQRPNRV